MSLKRFVLVSVVLLAVLAVVAAAPRGKLLTVREINAAIKAQGAGWVAAENKFTGKSLSELKAMLGAFPPNLTAGGEEPAGETRPLANLPASFDWRSQNGYNWVTSVKDQGNCGSCWAFGTVAQLESLMQIYFSNPNLNPDLSEQFIVSCDTSDYGCDGGYMNRVYNFIRSTGTPDESCFPYQAADRPCSERCADWASRVHKIASWSWVCQSRLNNTTIKNAVYSNGPVTCTFDVYNDFFSYSSGCYKHVTGAYAGGHAVLIVGWTTDSCWIVKNSWGKNWGEQGFFKIKFSNCNFGLSSGKFSYAGN